MNSNLITIIRDAEKLSPNEQVELIAAITKYLQGNQYNKLINSDFWESRSIEELAIRQRYKKNQKLEINSSFWPDDESIDDFNNFINIESEEDRTMY